MVVLSLWLSLAFLTKISCVSVVPQPVYMNMDDLAGLRERRQQEQEEAEQDLKTPTQEDLDLDQPAGSDGSSSGYSGSTDHSNSYGQHCQDGE